jgi:hypothetical protein
MGRWFLLNPEQEFELQNAAEEEEECEVID